MIKLNFLVGRKILGFEMIVEKDINLFRIYLSDENQKTIMLDLLYKVSAFEISLDISIESNFDKSLHSYLSFTGFSVREISFLKDYINQQIIDFSIYYDEKNKSYSVLVDSWRNLTDLYDAYPGDARDLKRPGGLRIDTDAFDELTGKNVGLYCSVAY